MPNGACAGRLENQVLHSMAVPDDALGSMRLRDEAEGAELRRRLSGIRALAFDLDDTLYEEADWIVAAIHDAAASLSLDPLHALSLAEEFIAHKGHAGDDIFNYILTGCGQSDCARNLNALVAAIQNYRPQPASMSLFAGVREALQMLGQRYELSLLLLGNPETQRAKIRALGLDELIHRCVYAAELLDVPVRWPSVLPLRILCERLGCRPDAVLWVADNPYRDFELAKREGLLTCRVLTGLYRNTAFADAGQRAHFVISSAAQLPNLLRGEGSSYAPQGHSLQQKDGP